MCNKSIICGVLFAPVAITFYEGCYLPSREPHRRHFRPTVNNRLVMMEYAGQTTGASSSGPSRFVDVSEEDTIRYVESMKNGNTKRKTKNDLTIFKVWLESVSKLREPEDISVPELDTYLARLFLSARPKKKQQSEYEPDTLRSILASISRHLQEKKQNNIIKDDAFKHCKDVLQSKMKELKSKGLGNKRQKADPITQEEIERLYQQNLLGTGNCLFNANANGLLPKKTWGELRLILTGGCRWILINPTRNYPPRTKFDTQNYPQSRKY